MTSPSFRDPARRGPGTRLDVLAEGREYAETLATPACGSPRYLQDPWDHLLPESPFCFPLAWELPLPPYPGNSRQKRHQRLLAQPRPLRLATELQSGGDEGSGPPSSLGQHLRLLSLRFPLPLWGHVTGMAFSTLWCPRSKMAITISALAGPPGSPGEQR